MDRKKVLVIGYYHRKNLGDDVFEHVFINYFQQRWPKTLYTIINIDDLEIIPDDTSLVIFGGGDLINDYFIHKIRPFIENKSCPWYAISIGIPYPSLIDKGYLDRFDYIIHRNRQDELVLENKFNNNLDKRSEWFPDISYMLPLYHNPEFQYYNHNESNHKTKKIGIFLSRSMYYSDNPGAYKHLVNNIAIFLSKVSMIHRDVYVSGCGRVKMPLYDLYLLPFSTDEKFTHDDRIINKDLFEKILDFGYMDNVHVVNDQIHMDKLNPLFDSFHMTICTRFHAHMFSLMSRVPVLSIYTTRKVDNLISEIGCEDSAVKITVDPVKHYPIDIDENELWEKFNYIIDNYNQCKNRMTRLHNIYKTEIDNFVRKLDNLIFYEPRYVLPDEIENIAIDKAKQIADKIISYLDKSRSLRRNISINDIHEMLEINNNNLIYVTDSNIKKRPKNNKKSIDPVTLSQQTGAIGKYCHGIDPNRLAELISYRLTGLRVSEYNYGISQQILSPDYNLLESCKWILKSKYSQVNNDNIGFLDNDKCKLVDRKLNITHVNNDLFHGYHRSGWSYVLKHIEELHNPRGVIFDSYLDKTFGWESDFLSTSGVIPYKKSWIGVLHHTSNTDYTENNLVNVFNNKHFVDSLLFCKGLIVLSDYNKRWIDEKIELVNIDMGLELKTPVVSLYHPTELVPNDMHFNCNTFLYSHNRKLVQIGAWLRDSYSIYDLVVPHRYNKYALKGKSMNNYFITDDIYGELIDTIKIIGSGHPERNSAAAIENKDINKYIVGLINRIDKNNDSVTILEELSNDEYDELLSNSIVFINLVDASAVNTILECIVRNTPILVNRLPATEQYLGSNYPLFYNNYNDYQEINRLLSDRNIRRTHKYLMSMNKNKFTIDYFFNSLVESEIYKNL